MTHNSLIPLCHRIHPRAWFGHTIKGTIHCDYSVFVTEKTDDAFPTVNAILLACMTVQSSLLTYHTLHTVEFQKDAKQLEACSECQKGNSLPCTEFNATAIPTFWQGSARARVCVCMMVV